jgi:predicted dienelactone hydrolase
MLAGFSRELFKINEFVDRPKDVSFLLDELERRNASEFGGRLDLNNVVAVGHSFGGTTVFALGGATIDFEMLQSVCDRPIWGPNISLLLQCLALKLPRQEYNFRDERVQSIIAINPVNSAIFGERGIRQIKVPTMIGAGSKDPATPAAAEQLRTFVWLPTLEKYLILIEGQAHVNFTQLDANTQALIKSLPNISLPQQSLIDEYANGLLLSFAEVYGARNETYRPFLTASFAQYISREPNRLFFAEASAEVPLSKLFNRLRPELLPPLVPPVRSPKVSQQP